MPVSRPTVRARAPRAGARWAARLFLVAVAVLAVQRQAPVADATVCPVATTISWDGGAGTTAWHTAANWTGDRLPAATDHVCIPDMTPAVTVVHSSGTTSIAGITTFETLTLSGGSLSVSGSAEDSVVSAMNLAGGVLGGSGTVAFSGVLTWSAGEMAGSGTTRVLPGGQLLLNASTYTYLGSSRVIDNAGTFTWATSGGYGLYAYAGSLVTNSGLFEVTTYGSVINQASAGQVQPRIHNTATGVLRKTGSTSTWTVAATIDNDGLVEATTGTVRLTGGDDGVAAHNGTFTGSVEFGAGTFSLDGARLAGGRLAGAYLRLGGTTTVPAGGTFTVSSGTLGGTGVIQVSGTLVWSGGGMADAGTTRVEPGGQLLLNNSSDYLYLNAGRTIDNAGTMTWSTGGGYGVYTYAGSVIRNSGLLEVTTYGSLMNQAGTGAAPRLHNTSTGVVRKVTSTSTWTVGIPVDNDGEFGAAAGVARLTGGDDGVAAHNGTFTGSVEFGAGTFSLDGARLAGGRLAGAYLRLGGTTTVPEGGTFTVSSGTLGGTGVIQVSGTLVWSGGAMSDSGTTRVDPGGSLLLNNSSDYLYLNAGRTIDNAGTMTWSTGGGYGVYAYAGSLIRNSGVFEVTTYGSLMNQAGTGAAPRLHNTSTGVVRKVTSTSTWTVGVPVDNDGEFGAAAGVARLTGGDDGVLAHGGVFKAGVEFGSGTYSLDGAQLAGARLAGAYLRLGGTTTVPAGTTFTVGSGVLGGGGVVEVSGTLVWSGGAMSDAGVTKILAGGQLLLNNGSEHVSLNAGRTIDNAGTMTWSTGGGYGVYAYAGSVIRTSGLFEVTTYGSLMNQAGTGTAPRLHNTGLLRKVTSPSTWTVGVPVENDGDVESAAGAIRLTGGDASGVVHAGAFKAGVEFASGTYSLDGAQLAGARLAGAYLRLDGVTTVPAGTTFTAASGVVGGTGTVKVSGTLVWSGGAMSDSGTTRVEPGGQLLLNNGGEFTALNAGRTIDNAGTMTWSTANGYGVYAYAGSLIRNSGVFEVTTYGSLMNQAGTGTAPRLHNTSTGVVRKVTSTSTWTVGVPVDNDGEFGAAAGVARLTGGDDGVLAHGGVFKAGVEFGSGTYSLDGAQLAGARLAGAYLRLGGTTTVPAGTTFTVGSGTLGGTGTVKVSGTLVWSGGAMSDAGTTRIEPGGQLLLNNGGEFAALNAGRTIDNAGTMTWSTANGYGIYAYAGAVIRNSGVFEATTYGSIVNQAGTGTAPRIENLAGGTITKSVGTSTWTIGIPVDNDGQIGALTGITRLTAGEPAGATHSGTFGTGAEIAGGTFTLDGASLAGARQTGATVRATGPATVPAGATYTLVSGTLGGTGTVRVDGTLSWSGGRMSDAGTTHVRSNGQLLLNNGSDHVSLDAGRMIVNDGTLTWAPVNGYGMYAYQGTVIHNAGVFEAAVGGTLMNQAGAGTPPLFSNTGTIRKTGTTSLTIQANVDNAGTVQVEGGTLTLSGNLLNYSALRRTLTGGTFDLRGTLRVASLDVATNAARIVLDGAGAVLADTSSQDALRNLSRNAGNGHLLVHGRALTTPGAFTNTGRVTLGAAAQLTATGGYVQGAGVTTLAAADSRVVSAAAPLALSGGTLAGAGTVDGGLSNDGGTVDPAGTLTVPGGYVQGAGGTLLADVSATGSDRLVVGGAATLDGALTLRTEAGLAQADGDRYTVVDHGSRTGHFAAIEGAAASGLVYVAEHEPSSVAVVVRPAGVRDTGGAVAVAGGATYSATREVTLTVTPGTGAVAMRVGNDGAAAGAYQPVVTSLPWTLADADGTRTVHVQFRDAAGNESTVVTDTIVLDRRAPVATIQPPATANGPVVVLFDEPVSGVTSQNVVLRLGATSAAVQATTTCYDAAGTVVSCVSGAVRKVVLQPATPLLPGASYTAVVNPAGAPSWVVDRAGNRAATTSRTFTGPTG